MEDKILPKKKNITKAVTIGVGVAIIGCIAVWVCGASYTKSKFHEIEKSVLAEMQDSGSNSQTFVLKRGTTEEGFLSDKIKYIAEFAELNSNGENLTGTITLKNSYGFGSVTSKIEVGEELYKYLQIEKYKDLAAKIIEGLTLKYSAFSDKLSFKLDVEENEVKSVTKSGFPIMSWGNGSLNFNIESMKYKDLIEYVRGKDYLEKFKANGFSKNVNNGDCDNHKYFSINMQLKDIAGSDERGNSRLDYKLEDLFFVSTTNQGGFTMGKMALNDPSVDLDLKNLRDEIVFSAPFSNEYYFNMNYKLALDNLNLLMKKDNLKFNVKDFRFDLFIKELSTEKINKFCNKNRELALLKKFMKCGSRHCFRDFLSDFPSVYFSKSLLILLNYKSEISSKISLVLNDANIVGNIVLKFNNAPFDYVHFEGDNLSDYKKEKLMMSFLLNTIISGLEADLTVDKKLFLTNSLLKSMEGEFVKYADTSSKDVYKFSLKCNGECKINGRKIQ